jgi:uncharacterized membrane protein
VWIRGDKARRLFKSKRFVEDSSTVMLITFLILAVLGLLISLYFTLVFHGVLKADTRLVPKFCRLGEKTCQSIIHAPEARLFGQPNFHLGLVYYGVLIGVGMLPEYLQRSRDLLLIAGAVTVLVAFYLSYALFFRLRIPCVLCLTSHAINLLIFILVLIS